MAAGACGRFHIEWQARIRELAPSGLHPATWPHTPNFHDLSKYCHSWGPSTQNMSMWGDVLDLNHSRTGIKGSGETRPVQCVSDHSFLL